MKVAAFQWQWLGGTILRQARCPKGPTQFNGITKALVARVADVFEHRHAIFFHGGPAGNPEDYGPSSEMGWAAREAGLGAQLIFRPR